MQLAIAAHKDMHTLTQQLAGITVYNSADDHL